jgi:hypothetical protein
MDASRSVATTGEMKQTKVQKRTSWKNSSIGPRSEVRGQSPSLYVFRIDQSPRSKVQSRSLCILGSIQERGRLLLDFGRSKVRGPRSEVQSPSLYAFSDRSKNGVGCFLTSVGPRSEVRGPRSKVRVFMHSRIDPRTGSAAS